ncbi:CAP domain-containing protein [Microdochium bolleyi]|uniref:CAP domain-containing protein n=1 Tax=Microdochium bolleyi TaxID=196109 RepID=A0A136IM47_9PEZI|nr:CAP domain-containing protein [Microdochium bolleyi]
MKLSLAILATAAATGTTAATFKETALNKHNAARGHHHDLKLKWSDSLAKIAQGHVNSCEFKHKVEGTYGQNIGWTSWTGGTAPSAVTKMSDMIGSGWYSGELAAYKNYWGKEPNMDNFEKFGHMTQLIWKSTTSVGCAYKLCNGGKAYFFECNYQAPGNYVGQFAKNVPKPR